MPLLCKNCGSISPDGSSACQNCSIKGHFRPVENAAAEAQNGLKMPADPSLAPCRNCGSSIDRSIAVCPNCFFQQPSQAAKNGLLKLTQISFRN